MNRLRSNSPSLQRKRRRWKHLRNDHRGVIFVKGRDLERIIEDSRIVKNKKDEGVRKDENKGFLLGKWVSHGKG